MIPNSIVVGDTDPLVATLGDARGPVNLAGASVVMRMKSALAGTGHVAFSGACTVMQSTNPDGSIVNKGMVSYAWGTGQTGLSGSYRLQWVVTWATGKTRTFPNSGWVSLEIEPAQV